MANTPSTRVADSTLEVSDSRYARTEPSFLLHWIEFTYAFPSSFHLKVLELIIRSSHIGWLGLRGRQERLETRNYQHCKQKGLELHRGVIELAETNGKGKGASTHSTQWTGTKLSRIRNSYDLSFGRAKSRSYRKILLTRSCPRSGLIEGPIEKRTPKAALYTRKGLSKGTSQLGNNYRRKDLQRGTEQFAVVKAPTYERSKGDWRILPRAFCALALYPWIRVLVWISWAECLGNTLKKGEFYYSNSNPISDFVVSLLIRQSSDLLYLLNEDLQLQQKNGCAHESILCYGSLLGGLDRIELERSRR
ncbi:hypothetical protein SADUNF_SadunfMtG0010600 (mitochondrion) [Salix dunnii]|uniref:Uncharacterized protein n=1 Tax=Salix dunnii TaxID=1413687 RepID=A0A835IXJ9_9ROSI|nr:hypothetical protein SADUNF_SadunfMtG0010600 [Salix dunnii]